MSRRSSTSAKGGAKKAKGQAADPDVYVAMLFVSAAALTTGIIFLYLECNRYNWLLGR
ncbi:MAG: hypothetical protein JWN70_2343 [Planctomycetaceae bacterium]|nr:hypothetical protein [Planctomycetaceae bacterium]